MAKEQQEDVDTLKRRGRRRLVGAVALVLLAVIVLPMVFDPEPRRSVPPVSVRVPGEDDSAFAPKPPPARAPERKAEEKTAQTIPAAPKAPAPPVAKKPEPAERARAEAALAGEQFVVPVGAFANPQGVIAKLAAAKIPHYTEPLSGNVTRVRAGPFASKDAADKAADKLKAMGFKPGAPAAKPG